ncbi:apolipoprotein N-acyltransferase [Pectobacterium actinidiae]|uniref:apolipoprotein N-acyltransferase n=1 Tax=Pectobacterium actinidiae TaxID=1507808 RepID=UPI0038211360
MIGSAATATRLAAVATLALAGAVHALTFSPGPLPTWSLAAVQLLTLTLLARACLQASRGWQAFLSGWWFGLMSFGIGLYWVFISMHHHGGLPVALAILGVAVLSAFLALFTGLACGLTTWLLPVAGYRTSLASALTWAAAWAAMEWLRSILFSGFPWLNIGYAHVDGPLAGWAPLVGVHGMALLAAFVAAVLAAPRLTPTTVAAALLPLLAGSSLIPIEWSRPYGEPLHVRLVQGNIDQSQKFDPAFFDHSITRHLQLASRPPVEGELDPDLIVLPETVLPLFQNDIDPLIWEKWRALAKEQQSAIAMGVPLHTVESDGSQRQTNSAIGFDANTPVQQLSTGTVGQRYDKRHLVPWGEYVPSGFGWFVQMLDMPLGEFDRGSERQSPFAVGGQHLGLNICYENVFGPELLPALWPDAGDDPGASILVNLSNLGWFGETWALRQHLQIGRLRSMETARPMLTSTNTGITASIDPKGRVMAALPPHQAGVLPVSVQGTEGFTPYARYGDAMVLLLLLTCTLLIALMRQVH